jgi:riboflavin kinase/FMN adenylyltransferase
LRELGQSLGFSVTGHSVLRIHGVAVSSSHIRTLIAEGAVERARKLLGRPFSIQSTPATGRGIGTRLLVPTINLADYSELKPAHGVYISRLTVATPGGPRTFQAITNAGNRPTFGQDSYAIESHLLDFEPIDLAQDTPLELTFLHRLRGEQRFPSPDALKQQIGRDIGKAHRYHHLTSLLSASPRSA